MKDLGTYFLRVEFEDGRGYIQKWSTAGRFLPITNTAHMHDFAPLESWFQKPHWENEHDLIETIMFMYMDGNYSCDCNRGNFIQYATGNEHTDVECGDTIILKRLTLIRPNGESEMMLFEKGDKSGQEFIEL